MTRRVLLDTNMLIGALEPEPDNVQHQAARSRFRALMDDPEIEPVITPLVRYEVLRGVRRISFDKMKSELDGFQEFDVRSEEANRAAELFRLAKGAGMNLDKRSFDLFHCACADVNGLKIESQDPHIRKIQQLIQGSQQNAKA
ncbi:MAG: PIN domain-containing protein [Candidatus Accumulibacter sp.]|jgi:predicted nucleic acid-binding protein|nr:PIN domain-containing protein [Accumulibacter sp.]